MMFKSELQLGSDYVAHRLTQPSENIILERNKQLRLSPKALYDLGSRDEQGTWGRQIASIPFIVYEKAIKSGYDLNSKDSETANKEMARFLKSPAGRACLVS